MGERKLREELVAAFKNRAILYWLIFDELRSAIGQEPARALLKRAIYRRGEQIGQRYRPFAPDDWEGLQAAFLAMEGSSRYILKTSPSSIASDSTQYW